MAEFIEIPEAMLALKTSPSEPVYQDLQRRVLRVDAAAKALCPVDTGRLRGSIRWRIEATPDELIGYIGTDVKYAPFVHEGTAGGTIIRPVNKQALFWKGAAHPVASVTRGATRAQPFLRDALSAANEGL